MSLEVQVRHRLGELELDVEFVTEGRVTALYGPSGAGKTSLVSVIAGLIRPERGRVVVGGHVLLDTDRRICVPMHQRRVGCVFQDGRLFPHLSVRQNLLFGHWFSGERERYAQLDPIVELLGLGALLARRPALLSGGEKQRVAIGRALLGSPRVLLLDEPLASLDRARKAEILPYLERLRDEVEVPMIYVSHSAAEVTRLASALILLAEGKVRAAGATERLMPTLGVLEDEGLEPTQRSLTR